MSSFKTTLPLLATAALKRSTEETFQVRVNLLERIPTRNPLTLEKINFTRNVPSVHPAYLRDRDAIGSAR